MVPPTSGRRTPPSPPSSVDLGAVGGPREDAEMSHWPDTCVCVHTPSPTCVCVHTHPLLPLTWPLGSPEASLGTHGVNPAICQLCLAASASPAPTPYEPSWKAASLLAGRAGGWAWEAPGVSRRAPLPQHLQGLNSVGSGSRLPLSSEGTSGAHTHVPWGCAPGSTYALSLSLSLWIKHTQACTPIFKHGLTVPKKANTQKATHTHPPGLCTPLLRLRATHEHTQTHSSVLRYTTACSLTHTAPCPPGATYTEASPPLCFTLLAFNRSVLSNSVQTPRTIALQAPRSMGFLRQEY